MRRAVTDPAVRAGHCTATLRLPRRNTPRHHASVTATRECTCETRRYAIAFFAFTRAATPFLLLITVTPRLLPPCLFFAFKEMRLLRLSLPLFCLSQRAAS